MSAADYGTLVEATRKAGCVTMASPFDEASVDLCQELGVQILKIASSDLNDWVLIEKIATAKKPVVVSTGGSSLKDIDDLVTFFEHRNIPLAINHCVSLYPSENADLQLNQIDFMIRRYPNHTIGFSSHEYRDWSASIAAAYAKGARTFERHVDIDDGGSPYPRIARSPARSTPGSRPGKRPRRCAARRRIVEDQLPQGDRISGRAGPRCVRGTPIPPACAPG